MGSLFQHNTPCGDTKKQGTMIHFTVFSRGLNLYGRLRVKPMKGIAQQCSIQLNGTCRMNLNTVVKLCKK